MRFSPRVETKIPAEIERGAEKKDILIIGLGLDGAFIRNSIPAFDGKPSRTDWSCAMSFPSRASLSIPSIS